MKLQSFSVICLVALLIFGASIMARAADSPENPSVMEILRQSQAKYASLTGYSDEGVAAATLGQTRAPGISFITKLARTNLYLVAWHEADDTSMLKGVVWSAGEGNFLWVVNSHGTKRFSDIETALANATGSSEGAAATVPGAFFKLNLSGRLWSSMASASRLADDKIGGVDCFVLVYGAAGRTNMLWIGKEDFLIRQHQIFTSGAVVKQALEAQAQKNPQIRALLDESGPQLSQDVTTVETHLNVVPNPPLTQTDFDFQVPTGY